MGRSDMFFVVSLCKAVPKIIFSFPTFFTNSVSHTEVCLVFRFCHEFCRLQLILHIHILFQPLWSFFSVHVLPKVHRSRRLYGNKWHHAPAFNRDRVIESWYSLWGVCHYRHTHRSLFLFWVITPALLWPVLKRFLFVIFFIKYNGSKFAFS